MTRTPDLTIWSCKRGRQGIDELRRETLTLERVHHEASDDGPGFRADDVPEGVALFLDLTGAIVGQVGIADVPPGTEAIVAGARVFRRIGLDAFQEMRAVSAGELP